MGEEAESLREKYPEDIKDVALFPELRNRRDIVFISVDTSQWTRQEEARAIKQAGITALYFGPFFQKMGNKSLAQAIWLMKHWPKIKGYAEGAVRGTCAEIKQNGRAARFNL